MYLLVAVLSYNMAAIPFETKELCELARQKVIKADVYGAHQLICVQNK